MSGPHEGEAAAGAAPDLADLVAGTVLTVDGVADLHGGLFGEIATYLPGRQVPGIRLGSDDTTDIHIVVDWGVSVPGTADAVRRAVAPLVPGVVHVTVEDVAAAPATGP